MHTKHTLRTSAAQWQNQTINTQNQREKINRVFPLTELQKTHLTTTTWFIWSILQSSNLAVIALTIQLSTSVSSIWKRAKDQMSYMQSRNINKQYKIRNIPAMPPWWLNKEFGKIHSNQDLLVKPTSSSIYSHHVQVLQHQPKVSGYSHF